ncbi:MAG: HlyD family efflux transporter periplasmic adaptor subunit [Actinomycetota bacterium]
MSLSKAFRRNKGWLAAGALVIVAGTTYLVMTGGDATKATTTYQAEAVSVGTLSVTVAGTGNLEVDDTTDVYPGVAGTVATVEVSEGSLVETGAVLFTLDASSAEAETARALASLRQAEQGIAQAQLQITKAQGALTSLQARASEPTPTVTSADIDTAKAEVAVAKAQLASAQAQRTSAATTYEDALGAEDDLTVTAPCSGVVYSLDIAAGDSVSDGGDSGSSANSGMTASTASATSATGGTSTAPVVIAPEQPLSVHLTVNEVDLPSLELGQRADIEFDAFPDLAATGKVYEIADTGSNSSGVVTFDVWLSIDVADPRLRAGMSAAATIVTDLAKDTLIVPNSAVQSDDSGGYYVQVLESGSEEPRSIAVETGLASSTQTQILSGLVEGDLVVTQTLDTADDQTSSGAQGGGGGLMMPGMGGGPRD